MQLLKDSIHLPLFNYIVYLPAENLFPVGGPGGPIIPPGGPLVVGVSFVGALSVRINCMSVGGGLALCPSDSFGSALGSTQRFNLSS